MYIAVIDFSGNTNIKFSSRLSEGESHIAEEEALIETINIIEKLKLKEPIKIFCDDWSLVKLAKGEITKIKVINKYKNFTRIRDFFSTRENVSIQWIKGNENIAHILVRMAYNRKYFHI